MISLRALLTKYWEQFNGSIVIQTRVTWRGGGWQQKIKFPGLLSQLFVPLARHAKSESLEWHLEITTAKLFPLTNSARKRSVHVSVLWPRQILINWRRLWWCVDTSQEKLLQTVSVKTTFVETTGKKKIQSCHRNSKERSRVGWFLLPNFSFLPRFAACVCRSRFSCQNNQLLLRQQQSREAT